MEGLSLLLLTRVELVASIHRRRGRSIGPAPDQHLGGMVGFAPGQPAEEERRTGLRMKVGQSGRVAEAAPEDSIAVVGGVEPCSGLNGACRTSVGRV